MSSDLQLLLVAVVAIEMASVAKHLRSRGLLAFCGGLIVLSGLHIWWAIGAVLLVHVVPFRAPESLDILVLALSVMGVLAVLIGLWSLLREGLLARRSRWRCDSCNTTVRDVRSVTCRGCGKSFRVGKAYRARVLSNEAGRAGAGLNGSLPILRNRELLLAFMVISATMWAIWLII